MLKVWISFPKKESIFSLSDDPIFEGMREKFSANLEKMTTSLTFKFLS